jgi:predicted permease
MNERKMPQRVLSKSDTAVMAQDTSPVSTGNSWRASAMQDVRFALRTLRKAWGFTATAVLTLALGIGANTAIFQLLDAVRLRNLPVADPWQVARVEIKGGNKTFGIRGNEAMLTYPQWEEVRRNQQAFSDVFAWAGIGTVSVGEGSYRRRARDLWVSGEMFATLGVPPFRGRVFTAEDDHPDCGAPGAVISYPFWQSEFGGQDSAIGRKLMIQDRPTEVIGVTPPGFFGLEIGRTFDFALPFCALPTYLPNRNILTKRDYFWVRVMGRMKPGRTLEQASSQLDSISPGITEATLPSGYNTAALDEYRKFRITAYPGGSGVSWLRQTYDTPLRLLLGTTALVLLIACTNLANLLLARSSAREREMAVRLALGASRWRLIRELLSESVVLAAAGGILGMALAAIFSRSLVRFLSTEGDAIHLDLDMDWRVLAFTSATAIVTCVVFGLVPALRASRTEPGLALKAGIRGTTGSRERFSFQRALIISQIAISLVLLVGALLFVRSFWNLATIDPGFREKDILIASLGLQKVKLSVEDSPAFVRNLLEQVRSIPQVGSAATSTHIPLYPNFFWNLGVRVGAFEGASRFTWVSPGYFQTMEIPLLTGRDFDVRDTRTSPRVAIVNETFVRRYLGGGNALGKVIRTNAEPHYPEAAYEIVGVIRDTKYLELRETTPPMAFAPAEQFPAKAKEAFLFIFIRSASPPSALLPAVREKISQANSEVSVEFHVFQADIQNGLIRERMMALLSGFFGALAALLAMVGLYGVISYIIAMRKNEIGIRMALGASRHTITVVILGQSLYLLAAGVGLGLLMALAATRGAASLLFGLQPNDPLTLVAAAALLTVIALLASYVPARRASRVDPMIALRYE